MQKLDFWIDAELLRFFLKSANPCDVERRHAWSLKTLSLGVCKYLIHTQGRNPALSSQTLRRHWVWQEQNQECCHSRSVPWTSELDYTKSIFHEVQKHMLSRCVNPQMLGVPGWISGLLSDSRFQRGCRAPRQAPYGARHPPLSGKSAWESVLPLPLPLPHAHVCVLSLK